MNVLFDPEHVYVSRLTELAKYTGGRGFQSFLSETAETGEFERDLEGIVDVDVNTVLAVITTHMKGGKSGMAVEQRVWPWCESLTASSSGPRPSPTPPRP